MRPLFTLALLFLLLVNTSSTYTRPETGDLLKIDVDLGEAIFT